MQKTIIKLTSKGDRTQAGQFAGVDGTQDECAAYVNKMLLENKDCGEVSLMVINPPESSMGLLRGVDWGVVRPWYMELTGIYIDSVEPFYSHRLTRLYLDGCTIAEGCRLDFTRGFPELNRLFITQCGLTNLRNQVVFGYGIKDISLSDNMLTDVEGVEWPVTLQDLRVAHNQIKDFSSFVNLPRGIKFLCMGYNGVDNVDMSCLGHTQLIDLDISDKYSEHPVTISMKGAPSTLATISMSGGRKKVFL